MTENEFEKIVSNGETASIEFKSGVSRPEILAQYIAAFANTNGGRIFFGVREPNDIVGVQQKQRLEEVLSNAKKMLAGNVEAKISFFDYQGKNIGILTIEKADGLVSFKDGFYIKDSSHIRAMSAREIQSHYKSTGDSSKALSQLSEAVANQMNIIESLRKELAKANSPIRKAIFAIIGAVASLLFKNYLLPLIEHFWA